MAEGHQVVDRVISIHALCEEGDENTPTPAHKPANFYPRPLRGGRLASSSSTSVSKSFLSTPSARRATHRGRGGDIECLFLSTPSARRATQDCRQLHQRQCISIHALCEEGDEVIDKPLAPHAISIHALCEEGDRCPPSGCRS